MKKLNLLPFFSCTVLFLTSCMIQEPISSNTPVNNKTYQVDFLFEYDGCKVYRFEDHGNYIYFSNCRNETTSVINDSTFIRSVSGKTPYRIVK